MHPMAQPAHYPILREGSTALTERLALPTNAATAAVAPQSRTLEIKSFSASTDTSYGTSASMVPTRAVLSAAGCPSAAPLSSPACQRALHRSGSASSSMPTPWADHYGVSGRHPGMFTPVFTHGSASVRASARLGQVRHAASPLRGLLTLGFRSPMTGFRVHAMTSSQASMSSLANMFTIWTRRTAVNNPDSQMSPHLLNWGLARPARLHQVIGVQATLMTQQGHVPSAWHGWATAPVRAQSHRPAQSHSVVHVAALHAVNPVWVGTHTANFFITGYVATGSTTATGTWPHWGTIAVDPRIIPLGSTVYIAGLGYFHAEDTGGGVVGYHIDVFCLSVDQAYALTGYRTANF